MFLLHFIHLDLQVLFRKVCVHHVNINISRVTMMFRVLNPGMGAHYPVHDAVYFDDGKQAQNCADAVWINGGKMGKPIVQKKVQGVWTKI